MKRDLPIERMVQLYIEQELAPSVIAKRMDVGVAFVRHKLKEAGVVISEKRYMPCVIPKVYKGYNTR